MLLSLEYVMRWSQCLQWLSASAFLANISVSGAPSHYTNLFEIIVKTYSKLCWAVLFLAEWCRVASDEKV